MPADLTKATMQRPADHEARDRAIQTSDTHQFLDAGAGCGKTRVLVDHYVWILEHTPGITPHQIIAATFTRKAAAEMKERVRQTCRERAVLAGGDRWRQVARDIETAPIDTIHGLCNRILHENAIAAGIDPNFTVVQQTEATLLVEEVVRRTLLQRLDADVESAAQMVADLGLSKACEAVETVIKDRARLAPALLPEGRPLSADELTARWSDTAPRTQELLLRLLMASPPWRQARATLLDNPPESDADPLGQLRLKRLRLIEQAEDAALPFTRRLDALHQLRRGTVQASKAQHWASTDSKDEVAAALRTFSTSKGANSKRIDGVLGIVNSR